ncbi:butyrophilin-like protein 2 isoform 2-T2 [Lycodopsis pacificus]
MSVLEAFKLSKDHVCLTGGPRAVCPMQLIKVFEGENVALHCGLDPPFNLSRFTVDWSRVDNGQRVYVYRHGQDDAGPVVDQYRGRTNINHEALSDGNMTLNISSANLSDSGSYKCFVPKLKVWCEVQLIVEKGTKTDVSSTTGPPPEGPESDVHGAVKIVLPVGGVLLLVVAVVLLWRCGVIERFMRMLKGERQQEYERPRDFELQQRQRPR